MFTGMTTPAKILLTLLLTALVSACSIISTETDYEEGRDFTDYRAYAWSDIAVSSSLDVQNNTLLHDRIQKAINTELAARGLEQKVDSSQADVLLAYYYTVESRVDIESTGASIGYSYWNHPWGVGIQHDIKTRNYKAGTLIIDIIDRRDNKLVWRGSSETRLRSNQTPEQREARINDIVAAILAKFPPL